MGKFLKLAKILKNYSYIKHFIALSMKSKNENIIGNNIFIKTVISKDSCKILIQLKANLFWKMEKMVKTD